VDGIMIKVPSSKRYAPIIIDLDNKNNSHSLVIDLLGENKRVLKIGTSTGYVSKILKERGNTVIGVEIDSEAAIIASPICEMMIKGDIESIDLENYLQLSSFDVIVCADVLEHLKYSKQVLLKIKKYLKHDGYLVISLPNICHGDVLLTLMLREFRCTQIGLLDETHLRFFCLKNIIKLFNNCGYSITDLRTTNKPIGSTELNVDKNEISKLLLKFIEEIPDTAVYQYVFKALPSKNPSTEPDSETNIKILFNGLMDETIDRHKEPLFQEISSINEKLEQEKRNLKIQKKI
jgi:2-polyprenyl-3-methyl-5-hydroxy-6-metoxy-1,4-benzoquinol methylase